MWKKVWKEKRNHNSLVVILACSVAMAFGGCTDAQNFEASNVMQESSGEASGIVRESSEEGVSALEGKEQGHSDSMASDEGGASLQGMAFRPEDLKFITSYGESGEKTWFDGTSIVSAVAKTYHDTNGAQIYLVEIQLDEEGTKAFYDATKEHLGEKISIVQGDEVLSAPVVQIPIKDGRIVITGLNGWEEASELALGLGGSREASGEGQGGGSNASASGQDGHGENAQLALMEQGNRVVALLNEMLHNETYLESMGSQSLTDSEVFERLKETDYQEADNVYRITFSDDMLENFYALLFPESDLFGGMSEELKDSMDDKMLESYITVLGNATMDAKTVALQSILTAERLFAEPSACNEKCIYLYVFGDAYPVAVTFSGSEDGAVKAQGRFVMIRDFKAGSEQEVKESMMVGWSKYPIDLGINVVKVK